MDFSEASTELAKLILAGHYEHEEEAGLAIMLFTESIENGDDPAMALALAKNLEEMGENK